MAVAYIPVIKQDGKYIVFTNKFGGSDSISAKNLKDLTAQVESIGVEKYHQCTKKYVAYNRAADSLKMVDYSTGKPFAIRVNT